MFTVFWPSALPGDENQPLQDRLESISTVSAAAIASGAAILIVEDNPSVLAYVSQVLENMGFKVLEARNGKTALERLRREIEPVTLVITDVVMPGMSGVQLEERIRKQYPSIPVLLTSGYDREELAST